MGNASKFEPGEIVFLGIIGAILCGVLGVAILVIGIFNDMFSYWLTSSYWYVRVLALCCYLGEVCVVIGFLYGLRAKIYAWHYEKLEKKELVEIAKGRV